MNGEASGNAKKSQAITLEMEMGIIKQLERGEIVVDVAQKFTMNQSYVKVV